jgi:hypothetical protein
MRRHRLRVLVLVIAACGALLPSAVGHAAAGATETNVVAVGDALPLPSAAPPDAVAITATPDGLGWWSASTDGTVTTAGSALPMGDLAGHLLNRPIVGMDGTPSGHGFWLAASDGGIFTFGDAPYLGSTGAVRLNRPVVGMAATPSGHGYWLVASDGGIFTFGDAPFLGSTGNVHLNQPIVGMAATPSGGGYWLAASDGGIFAFGDAVFRGGGSGPTRAIAATPSGGGYWLVGGSGRIDALGDATPFGPVAVSSADGSLAAIAPTPSGLGAWLAVGRPGEVISISEPGGLSGDTVQWALDAAGRAGARATVYDAGYIGLLSGAAPGWRIPLSAIGVDAQYAAPLLGPAATAALSSGQVVLGKGEATMRRVDVGATLDLLGWDGQVHGVRVGAVVGDPRIGFNEIVLPTGLFGFRRPASVKIWGASIDAMEAAVAATPAPHRVGVSRTYGEDDPDDVSPLLRLKQVLGEPQYRPGRGDAVALHPAFTNNIVNAQVPVLGTVTCHRAILGDLIGALDDIQRMGLGGGLRTYSGCYNPRLVRGGDSGGSLSRHSYGIALDVNTDENAFGGRVSMDPRIVDAFHRHGFAWGGTWTRADGMHFEWAPR